jgi:hypothetical protein
MMCEGCSDNHHELCGMQTWCTCDCAGPESAFFPDFDPLDPYVAREFGFWNVFDDEEAPDA